MQDAQQVEDSKFTSQAMDDNIPESVDKKRHTEMCFVSYLSQHELNTSFHNMKGKIYFDQTGHFHRRLRGVTTTYFWLTVMT
jgi:hypothetical protein